MENVSNGLNQKIPTRNLLRNSDVWSEVHPILNDLNSLLLTSIHSKKKIWWIGKCGHEWVSMIHHRTTKDNRACPFCTNVRFLSGVTDIATRAPELMSEWDFAINGDPSLLLFRPKLRYSWIGKNCNHHWASRLDHRLRGDGCPICAGYLILPGFNDLGTIHPSLARKVVESNPNVDPTQLGHRSYLKVMLNCDKCKIQFEDSIRRNSDKPGAFCKNCRKLKSSLELVVSSRLEDLGIEFIQQSKPLRYIDEKGRKRVLEIDFILPEYSLGFEVQDFSTHSIDRDDELTSRSWGSDGQFKLKKGPTYHELKRRLALEQLNVNLIDIWQNELFDGQWERHLKRVEAIKAN